MSTPFFVNLLNLQSRACIRQSSLYAGQRRTSLTFLCRDIPEPQRWPIETTSAAGYIPEAIGRHKPGNNRVLFPETLRAKSSRPSISIHALALPQFKRSKENDLIPGSSVTAPVLVPPCSNVADGYVTDGLPDMAGFPLLRGLPSACFPPNFPLWETQSLLSIVLKQLQQN